MKIKKEIRKPLNWVDFEDLCKNLWGEIWEIPDKIKKFGRSGNEQDGIDVIGIPKGKFNPYGVQCKGRTNFGISKLSENDIDKEIDRAKRFEPKLEVFIIATTANKNALIEKYVLKKSVENLANGDFEILLFSWEDIADLIEKNPNTFNLFVKSKHFNETHDFEVCFSDGLKEAVLEPEFKKTKFEYIRKREGDNFNYLDFEKFSMAKILYGNLEPNVNNSWDGLEIEIHNKGNKVIENYQIDFWTDDDAIRGITGVLGGVLEKINHHKFTSFYTFDDLSALYKPKDNEPLVPGAVRRFNIYFLTQHKEYSFDLNYKLISRDFQDSGNVTLNVKPTYSESRKVIVLEATEDDRETHFEIADLLTHGSIV
jgi:hypothetical protein